MKRQSKSTRLVSRILCLSALAWGPACDEDDGDGATGGDEYSEHQQASTHGASTTGNATSAATGDTHESGESGGSDSGGDATGIAPHGSVAVITQVFTADEPVSYIVQAPTLAGGVELKLDNAIELPGRALGAGPGARALFIGGSDSASLTRYLIDDAGVLSNTRAASFINQGVAAIGEYQSQLQFFAADRGYFFHGGTGQMITFNPTELTVSGASQIPGAVVQGAITTFAPDPIVDGTTLYFPMGWRGDDNLSVVSQAAVLVVDTVTGQQQLVSDPRCGYVRDGAMGADGNIYLATEAYASAVYRIAPDAAPAPCMLRFDPRTRSFDAGFHVALGDLVGGAIAGSIIVGTQGQAYLRVLDETLIEIAPDIHPRRLASAAAWSWWQLSLGDSVTAQHVPHMPVTGGSTLVIDAGGRKYFPNFAADYSSTSFLSLDESDAGAQSATVPGLAFSVVDL